MRDPPLRCVEKLAYEERDQTILGVFFEGSLQLGSSKAVFLIGVELFADD